MEQAFYETAGAEIKRTVKDSVFGDLFGNPKYLLQLYQALHPEDTEVTEKDLKDVTITNVLTDQMYNDLGFRVRDSLLVLAEAQSTWTVNILPRVLMYLGETYNRYFTENSTDLYGSRKVSIPKPELYVIFTGEMENIPQNICLKDEFFNGEEVDVNIRVKILAGGSDDIISQYVTFSKVATDMIKNYGKTPEAIRETLRICRDKNVLVEYLKEREAEVMSIMESLFDQEEVTRRYFLRVASENRAEGKAEGRAEGEYQTLLGLVKDGILSAEEAAKRMGVSVEKFKNAGDTILV